MPAWESNARLNLSKRSHSDKGIYRDNEPCGQFLKAQNRAPILIVIAFLSFKLLLERNMGSVNEVDICPGQTVC